MYDRADSSGDPDGSQDPVRLVRSVADLKRLLRGLDGFEAIAALVEGDPLNLTGRARDWVVSEGYMLDLPHVIRKAQMVALERVPALADDADLDAWVKGILEDVKWSLLRADDEALRAGEPLPEPLEARFLFLGDALGMEPAKMLPACVAMNGLPDLYRRGLYGLLVLQESFTIFSEREGISIERARDILVDALVHVEMAAERGGRDE